MDQAYVDSVKAVPGMNTYFKSSKDWDLSWGEIDEDYGWAPTAILAVIVACLLPHGPRFAIFWIPISISYPNID